MLIAHSPDKLRPELDKLRYQHGKRTVISLVTTRGDLHDGHGAVINAAATISDHVVVANMPNHLREDGKVVSMSEFQDFSFSDKHQAEVVYAPPEDYLFPNGHQNTTLLSIPGPLTELEYDPVALTTHMKIINAVQPDIMVWGERNFIEYAQIRHLLNEFDVQTQLHCIPTVRHANGVAVSGNDELIRGDAAKALPMVYETLKRTVQALRTGARDFTSVENSARHALMGAGFDINYFSILDEKNLHPAQEETTAFRVVSRTTISDIPIIDCVGLNL